MKAPAFPSTPLGDRQVDDERVLAGYPRGMTGHISLHIPSRSFPPDGLPVMNNLRTRLYWIMGLRMALVALMLGLSLAFQVGKGGRIETFYTLIIVTCVLTIPSAILLRVLTSQAALTILFWAQVAIDFLLETVLVTRTGGIESPFAVLYVMTVAVASLVPRRRVGLFTACFCIIFFGVLTNIQLYGLIEEWSWMPS